MEDFRMFMESYEYMIDSSGEAGNSGRLQNVYGIVQTEDRVRAQLYG